MRFRILWGQGDGQLERFNGSLISALHLKNAAKLVQEKRILRLRRGKLLQFRARAIALVELDVGHSQGEPVPIVERGNGLGLFPGDGSFQVLGVEEEDATGNSK